jgi:glycerol uptake facilitator-like aquaporin
MTFGKKELATLVAEFLGTGVLTLVVLSVQRSTIGVPFFVAIAAGLAVAVMSFAVSGVSGGHFNPALTLGMWTARKIETVSAVLYIAVQLLAGFAVYHLYTYYVNNDLQSVGGDFTWRILIAEAVGTAVLAFGWASAFYQRFTPAVKASVYGLAYTVGIIAASSAAIGLLNPAVALGVKSWVWGTYVLGPVVGALVGVNLYAYLFSNGVGAAKAAVAAPAPAAKKPSTRKKKSTRAKK